MLILHVYMFLFQNRKFTAVAKIPKNKIEMFQKNQDTTYCFSIDPTISFEELLLMEETELILANLFRDYWATPYQKQKIKEKERQDRELLEQEKSIKHNPYQLFKKKRISHK